MRLPSAVFLPEMLEKLSGCSAPWSSASKLPVADQVRLASSLPDWPSPVFYVYVVASEPWKALASGGGSSAASADAHPAAKQAAVATARVIQSARARAKLSSFELKAHRALPPRRRTVRQLIAVENARVLPVQSYSSCERSPPNHGGRVSSSLSGARPSVRVVASARTRAAPSPGARLSRSPEVGEACRPLV